MTEERRKELTKMGGKMLETAEVAMRNVRRETNERLKKMEKEKAFSKDDSFKLQEEVQKTTDRYIGAVESVYAEKEKEILRYRDHESQKVKLPQHVAIIMDGNGRWARNRALPRAEGHIAGIESVRDVVTATREFAIPYLTLYAFSKENWTRPKEEVEALLALLAVYLQRELPLMMKEDIRFRPIGDIGDLPLDLQEHLNGVSRETEKNKSMLLNIALSYSGREEILRATRLIAEDLSRGSITDLDEESSAGTSIRPECLTPICS